MTETSETSVQLSPVPPCPFEDKTVPYIEMTLFEVSETGFSVGCRIRSYYMVRRDTLSGNRTRARLLGTMIDIGETAAPGKASVGSVRTRRTFDSAPAVSRLYMSLDGARGGRPEFLKTKWNLVAGSTLDVIIGFSPFCRPIRNSPINRSGFIALGAGHL